jgi:hypothetical protein
VKLVYAGLRHGEGDGDVRRHLSLEMSTEDHFVVSTREPIDGRLQLELGKVAIIAGCLSSTQAGDSA